MLYKPAYLKWINKTKKSNIMKSVQHLSFIQLNINVINIILNLDIDKMCIQ